MCSLITGMDLQPADFQHASFLVHIFLAFQISRDLTKDKSDTTTKKHAESVLFPFITCPLLSPELWMLATASRHTTIEHGEREQNTLLQDLLSAMAKDVLSLLGCGREVLKFSSWRSLETAWSSHGSMSLYVCRWEDNISFREHKRMQCM